jgi:hypothetical protein
LLSGLLLLKLFELLFELGNSLLLLLQRLFEGLF